MEGLFNVVAVVVIAAAGYFLVKRIAQDAVSHWARRNISPGVAQQRSIVFPRIWTFKFLPTKKFIQELNAPPEHPEYDPTLRETFLKLDVTSEFLYRLVIEEYATRIRVHRWLAHYSGSESDLPPEDASGASGWYPAHSRYDWFDVAHHPHWASTRGSGLRDALDLWDYSTERMHRVLKLSGAWRKDVPKDRIFFQLTLWVERIEDLDEEIPSSDVLFEVPLDPGILDDQRGEPVYVGGEERKASEVLPYPDDGGDWEAKSGEGDDWRWSWYLRMQTFDRGSMF
ncbi:MAG: hypothetical protein ACE5IJ_12085 [Thermoplasmata archaeon]